MFDFIGINRKVKELEDRINFDIAETNKQICELVTRLLIVEDTVIKLTTELHGTQSSLYALINNLNKDLKLNKKGQPLVVKRKLK